MNKTPRQLGLMAAIAIVTGESVALGIFLTPASMAKSLGSPALLLAVWLGMGLMAMCGALCYAELAVRLPESGGDYVYLRAGFGERVAFLYGWMSTVVNVYPGVAASLAVGSAACATAGASRRTQRWVVACFPASLLDRFRRRQSAWAAAFSGRLMSVRQRAEVRSTVWIDCMGRVFGQGARLELHTILHSPCGLRSAFRCGLSVRLSARSSALEAGGKRARSPVKCAIRNEHMPLAFVGGVGLVIAIYLLMSFTFIAVIPLGQLNSNSAFVAQFGAALFGSAGATVLSVCVLLCVFGGLSALMMAAPRVCFAMAQSGSFFASFGRLSRRLDTPVNAILLQTGLALLVLFFGAFDRMLSYVIFTAVVFLGLTASTLFRLPQRVAAWWFPVAPCLFYRLLRCACAAHHDARSASGIDRRSRRAVRRSSRPLD